MPKNTVAATQAPMARALRKGTRTVDGVSSPEAAGASPASNNSAFSVVTVPDTPSGLAQGICVPASVRAGGATNPCAPCSGSFEAYMSTATRR